MFKGLLTFTDLEFTPNLLDQESQEFKDLNKAIRTTFTAVYNEVVPSFLNLKVVQFIEDEKLVAEVLVIIRFDSTTTAEDLDTLTIKASEENKFGDYKLSKTIFEDVTDEQEPSRRRFNTVVTVVNLVFTPELSDTTSVTFKNLSKKIEAALSAVYRNAIPGFLYLKVISFKKGSVICNFVVVTTPKSNATENSLKDVLLFANDKNELGGMKLSEEIVVNEVKASKTTRSTKMELWIIILISVGIPVLMVALIVAIVYVSLFEIVGKVYFKKHQLNSIVIIIIIFIFINSIINKTVVITLIIINP